MSFNKTLHIILTAQAQEVKLDTVGHGAMTVVLADETVTLTVLCCKLCVSND